MNRLMTVVLCLSLTAGFAELAVSQEEELAYVFAGPRSVAWVPLQDYAGITLSVSQPDGSVFSQTFPKGKMPRYDLPRSAVGGVYTWELSPVTAARSKRSEAQAAGDTVETDRLIQSGRFTVDGGAIQDPQAKEPEAATKDVLHYDDVITTGSFCVGFDCQNGESFGYDTIRLKEHNLRIHFEDTSYTASYPTNDWRIEVNSNSNGGGSYFSVQDATGGTTPFLLEAGADNNSLYVDDYGRVGFGTSTPVVELHVKDNDTPSLRLEQDSSGGWSPQTWDVAGNESNFFIRDATNGSKLPFRIQPSAPSSTLCLKSDGKVGIGTWSPAATLELEETSADVEMLLDRTDGVTGYMNAGAERLEIGTDTEHEIRLTIDRVWKMRLFTYGALAMSSGAVCTQGGVWTDASSRDLKENIEELDAAEAFETLDGLSPVKYNYKVDKQERHVGFIAEDVPELVATSNRKGMSPMDVTAVLTKVVQEQQALIRQLEGRIQSLEESLVTGQASPEAE